MSDVLSSLQSHDHVLSSPPVPAGGAQWVSVHGDYPGAQDPGPGGQHHQHGQHRDKEKQKGQGEERGRMMRF